MAQQTYRAWLAVSGRTSVLSSTLTSTVDDFFMVAPPDPEGLTDVDRTDAFTSTVPYEVDVVAGSVVVDSSTEALPEGPAAAVDNFVSVFSTSITPDLVEEMDLRVV